MKLVEKMLLLKPRTTAAAPVVTWASYLTALALPAWWRMRDTSGVTVVNSGSLGAAVDLTATAWTMAQAGQLGAGEAGLADGANTLLTCANNATLSAYNPWEMFFLVKPSSAGESNDGVFFAWGAGSENSLRFDGATTAFLGRVYNTLNTAFSTTTTTGIGTAAFSLVFVSFNEGDNKIHFRVGAGGAVTAATYSAQPALTGTYRAPTSALNLFNIDSQAFTFAGLCDEVGIIGGRTFTPAERLQMVVLAGV